MQPDFLYNLVVVFGLGLIVVLIFSKLRIPSVVGFLLTGILVGPHGLGLIFDEKSVEPMAEVGIVVLLFAIGVELSLGGLVRLGKIILVGGALQVAVTATLASGIALLLDIPRGTAILVGFIVALSSTAIVMQLLSQRAETGSPQGRISLGILIFQDFAVVPMMLAIPFLKEQGPELWMVSLTLAKAAAVVILVLVVARKVVPPLLHLVLATRSRELFLLCVIVICLGTAWLTSEAGLSIALGAFLAGLVISESEYSHHALAAVLPFRDAFSGLFFVSVGMLLQVGYVAGHPIAVLATTAAILVGKTAIITLLALALGHPIRIAVMSGVLLSQIGEFSFLLIHAGASEGVLVAGSEIHQLLMGATVLTMAITPLAVTYAPKLSRWVMEHTPSRTESGIHRFLKDHVIIVGYGLNGRNVAKALKHVDMPYVVLELNPEKVRRLQKEGNPIRYGDATSPDVLREAGIAHARVMVVTIPDAASARQIVEVAQELNSGVHLIVRTRFLREVPDLFQLGANEVVPEEFETSIEIFSRVLRKYLVPRDVVDQLEREARGEGYEMFRKAQDGFRPVEGLRKLLADVELEVYRVGETSRLIGKTLAEAQIRRETGAQILAIHREHETTPNPSADWTLQVNDVALLLGAPESLSKAGELFRGS